MQNTKSSPDLLIAGIVTGPLFVIISLIQAFVRKGFVMDRHPLSMLSLGEGGWIQITNFIIAGVLNIAFATGLRNALQSGVGSKWVPWLFGITGFAFILGGVFTADPALGFPPGAPEGIAKEMSFHGTIHAIAPALGGLASPIALLILARRFWKQNDRTWSVATVVTVIVVFILNMIPNITADWEKGVFNFLPMWFGIIISSALTSLVAMKLRSDSSIQMQAA